MSSFKPVIQKGQPSNVSSSSVSQRKLAGLPKSASSTSTSESNPSSTPSSVLGQDEQAGQNVKVVVRCRPMNDIEMSEEAEPVIECETSRKEVSVMVAGSAGKVESYHFDKVFDSGSTQEQVYQHVAAEIVEEMLRGYNCTVFAYGQTGTGKTHTMEGRRGDKKDTANWYGEHAGMIPRAVQHIFQHLEACCNDYTVSVSHLELYNEELIDLLCMQTPPPPLRILRDEKRGSMTVSGLEEIKVSSPEDIFKVLETSTRKRQTAETELNKGSSRSHCIFTVTVHTKEPVVGGEDLMRVGKLNLVDLAGSENTKRSGARDERMKEAQAINVSLLALGRVITSLTQKGTKREHIPYRDSNLTRLLQESLGGKAKTCIIATISPASTNLEETRSTLRYAFRAKSIKNNPLVNHKLTKKALIKDYVEEIESLKNQLWAARSKEGFYIDQENYNRMNNEISELTKQISSATSQISEKDEQITNLQTILNCKLIELQTSIEKHRLTKGELDQRNVEIQQTLQQLQTQQQQNQELGWINESHRATEAALTMDAKNLLVTAHRTTSDITALHEKIQRLIALKENDQQIICNFQTLFHQQLSAADEEINKFSQLRNQSHSSALKQIQEFSGSQLGTLEKVKKTVSQLPQSFDEDLFQPLKSLWQNRTEELEGFSQSNLQHMDEFFRDHCSSFLTLLKDKVKDAVDSLVTVSEQHKEKTISWQIAFLQRLEEDQEQLKKVNEQQQTQLSALKVQLEEYRSFIQLHSEETDLKVQQLLQQQKTHLSAQKNELLKTFNEKLEQMIDDHSVASQQIGDAVSSSLQNNRQKLTTLTESEWLPSISIAQKQSDSMVSTTVSAHSFYANELLFNRLQSSLQTSSLQQQQQLTALHSSVVDSCNSFDEQRQQFVEDVEKNIEEVGNKRKKEDQSQSDLLTKATMDLSTFASELCDTQLTDLQTRVENDIDQNLSQSLKSQHYQLLQFQETVQQNTFIPLLRKTASEMLEPTLKCPPSTKATPLRERRYPFPSALAVRKEEPLVVTLKKSGSSSDLFLRTLTLDEMRNSGEINDNSFDFDDSNENVVDLLSSGEDSSMELSAPAESLAKTKSMGDLVKSASSLIPRKTSSSALVLSLSKTTTEDEQEMDVERTTDAASITLSPELPAHQEQSAGPLVVKKRKTTAITVALLPKGGVQTEDYLSKENNGIQKVGKKRPLERTVSSGLVSNQVRKRPATLQTRKP